MTTPSLPAAFIERLQQIIPQQDYARCYESFHQARLTCFRVNTIKSSLGTALEKLAQAGIEYESIEGFDNAFFVPNVQRSILTGSELAENGEIYVQGLSSMLPPLVLDPQAGERILDIAAAPGSKTLQMAALMNNEGWISAVEIVKGRFHRLKDNLHRQGASIVHTYLMDGARVWKKCPEQFDRILVDAPCSSESRFSTLVPESFQYWSEKKIKEQSRKQGKLLFSAIQSLKPGGTLVYSTCSFAPEENEAIISKALKTFGEKLVLENIDLTLNHVQNGLTQWQKKTYNPQVEKCLRILPNRYQEGFFLCKIRKLETTHL